MYRFIGKHKQFWQLEILPNIKLNYNCPASEKGGKEGPGSCSNALPIIESEPKISKTLRNQYEKMVLDIQKELPSMINSVKHEIRIERDNSRAGRSGSSYHPFKDKFKELEKKFGATRKEYIKSLNNKIVRVPDSEYTLKLKPAQIKSSDNLRNESNKIIERCPVDDITAIESHTIDSYGENNILIDIKNFPDVGKIPTEVFGNIDEESTRIAIQKVFNLSDNQIIKNVVGTLKEEYWNTPDQLPSWRKTAYTGLQNSLKQIRGVDNVISQVSVSNELEVYSGVSSNIFSTNLKPGDEFQLKTFLSTSRLKQVASGFSKYKKDAGGRVVTIRLKPGTHAVALEDWQHSGTTFFDSSIYPYFSWTLADPQETHGWIVGESGKKNSGGNQREVLIGRNTKFKVIQFDDKNIILDAIP